MGEKRIFKYRNIEVPETFVSESDFLIAMIDANENKKRLSDLRIDNNY